MELALPNVLLTVDPLDIPLLVVTTPSSLRLPCNWSDYPQVPFMAAWKLSCVHILNGRHRQLADMPLVVRESM